MTETNDTGISADDAAEQFLQFLKEQGHVEGDTQVQKTFVDGPILYVLFTDNTWAEISRVFDA